MADTLPTQDLYNPSIDFVEPLKEDCFCLLCREVLENPMQLPCGHRLCLDCVKNKVGDGEKCPANDDECELIRIGGIFKDNSFKKEMKRVQIRCPWNGCTQTLKWGDLKNHEASCPWVVEICPNKGCKEMVSRSNEKHSKNCFYQLTTCKFCNEKILRNEIQRHEKDECKEGNCCCQLCGKTMKRKLIYNHTDVCPERPVKCPFSVVGCEEMVSHSRLERHKKEAVFNHIEYMNLSLVERDAKISKLESEQEELKNSLSKVKINIVEEMNESLSQQKFEKKLIDSEVAIFKTNKRLDMLADSLLKTQVEYFNKSEETLKNHIKDLENLRKNDSELAAASAYSSVPMPMNDKLTEGFAMPSEDGILIWKIDSFSDRRREAMTTRKTSIFSPVLHTSPYGYRIRLRLYPNGDGMGKDTHLSLFVVILKGEYDVFLTWPFQQRITFQVLDQTGRRKHISDSFDPLRTSSSFRRPVSDMNVASGCPCFVPLDDLDDRYKKADTIFIRCIIDTKNLHGP